MPSVDLHIHTTCSDGTDTPQQVVALAHSLGLSAIAITDHDTVAGILPAQQTGDALGVRVIPGIEVSVAWQGAEIHLLGYLINPLSPALAPVLDWAAQDRMDRNRRMVDLLQQAGYSISMQQLQQSYPDTVIGRPHMAQALLDAGQVPSIQAAFDTLLGEGMPFFLPRSYIPFEQAVQVIHSAGGVAVLAHPLQYDYSPAELEHLISTAKNLGVAGLEVYYSGYTAPQRQSLLQLAQKYHLTATGGSDYHGTRKPHIHLGTGTGDLGVTEGVVAALDAIPRTVPL